MIKYTEFEEKINAPAILIPVGVHCFPKLAVTFDLIDARSVAAIEECGEVDSLIFAINPSDPYTKSFTAAGTNTFGTIAKVKQVTKSNGNVTVTIEGVARGEKRIFTLMNDKYFVAKVKTTVYSPFDYDEQEKSALIKTLKQAAKNAASVVSTPSKYLMREINKISDLSYLSDFVASALLSNSADKDAVLAEGKEFERAMIVIEALVKETAVLRLEGEIKRKATESLDEKQRVFYLREQMAAIKHELGIDNEEDDDNFADKIMAKADIFPKEVIDKLLKENNKLQRAQFGSPENAVLHTYIETCLELPINKFTNDEASVSKARKILERDHFGLEKVKERILEFIAVKEFNPDIKNQIICLVGPPGVGKTSLCASVAEALNRKYVRVCLGGIHDESDIRGHIKTYVGAMPGKIVRALSDCGSSNPVMVFDEIDKMPSATGMHGDPAAAMLEVLDPEQNKAFRDNYLEFSIDLSRCMFIATANSLDTIPAPLRDRMEIIELSSYTTNEKFNIAKKHLIPKQLERHGISKKTLKISSEAIYKIIEEYTAEAGVRSLEREIASICRKAAKKIVEEYAETVNVSAKNISSFLGAPKYESEKIDDEDQIGVVNGMAYTSIGGDLLKLEASYMSGSGKLLFTGQLGDVMRESCEIAVSFIRANAKNLGIDPEFYSKYDIHIHAPEGAVPKDGPSAGITITTALVSILTGKAVRRDISMTGEITLTGKVLPIGGLKEKTLAAYRAGVKTIIIPKKNIKDLDNIDKEVYENVKFIPCDHINQVLDVALINKEIIAILDGDEVNKDESKCQ